MIANIKLKSTPDLVKQLDNAVHYFMVEVTLTTIGSSVLIPRPPDIVIDIDGVGWRFQLIGIAEDTLGKNSKYVFTLESLEGDKVVLVHKNNLGELSF